jgi:hypothetical protein
MINYTRMASRQRENCCFQSKCQNSEPLCQIECPIEEFIHKRNGRSSNFSKTILKLGI